MPQDNQQNGIQSHITDSKELTEAQRIRALLERRERVIDSLEAVSMAQAQSETKASESRLVFVSHLRSLILDLYPLLIQNDMLGDGEPIGTFQINPSDTELADMNPHELRAGADSPTTKTYTIDSLEWFTEHTFPITETWHVEYSGKRGRQSVTKEIVPPVRLCVKAVKRTMQNMAELNIDIEAHEDMGTFGFNYDEVESNEQKNTTDE